MRKLIPLFLSLIISAHAFAVVTDEECRSKSKKECGATAGCGWEKSSGVLGGSRSCKACQKDEYSEKVTSTDNNALECKQCSGITQYTNPDTGEVITYGANYYKYTLGAGRTITDCYANCELMVKDLPESTGKWMLAGDATVKYPNKCQFACYASSDYYNTCVSYYHPWKDKAQEWDTTVCEPSWIFMNSPAEIASKLPNDATSDDTYFCKNAQTGIYMLLQPSGITIMCSAQSCQTGYHLVSVKSLINDSLPGSDANEYYCKSDTLNIPNATLFQTCVSDTHPCSDDFGTECEITINNVQKTGTVGGNAVWNGINAYKTDQCTCTVSDDVATTGTYKHVCKRSTTSNTWDGASCETTIKTCNSGYCIVGYDANNKHQTCDTAPKGYYSDGRGVLECDKCPAGKTTASTGRTSVGECTYSTETQFCDGDGVDCFKLNYSSLGS